MQCIVCYVSVWGGGREEVTMRCGSKTVLVAFQPNDHVNLLDLSKQGNTTKLNISFPNEKRAAQVRFEPTTYCLRGRCSTH